MATPTPTVCCPAMVSTSTSVRIPGAFETSTGAIKEFQIDGDTLTSGDCVPTPTTGTCTAPTTTTPEVPYTSIKPLCGDASEKMLVEICGADLSSDRWVKMIPWWFWVVFGLVVLAMIISMIGMFVK